MVVEYLMVLGFFPLALQGYRRATLVHETLVFQREFDSMNLALLASFKHLIDLWQEAEGPQIKLDYGG